MLSWVFWLEEARWCGGAATDTEKEKLMVMVAVGQIWEWEEVVVKMARQVEENRLKISSKEAVTEFR